MENLRQLRSSEYMSGLSMPPSELVLRHRLVLDKGNHSTKYLELIQGCLVEVSVGIHPAMTPAYQIAGVHHFRLVQMVHERRHRLDVQILLEGPYVIGHANH